MSVSITRIQDHDPANSNTFNRPISEIESHINSIYSEMANTSDDSAIIIKNAQISADVLVGSLVYFDEESGVCRRALAVPGMLDSGNGRYIGDPCSRVIGIVSSISSGGVASIVTHGSIDNAACVKECINDGLDGVGQYFLSQTYPGKATKDPGSVLRIPVITYWGGSRISISITHQSPIQYVDPVVRSVESLNPLIIVNSDGSGNIKIRGKSLDKVGVNYSNTAISDISGSSYTSTPVVTNISGVGSGIKVMRNTLGEAYIGLSTEFGTSVEASTYNLNGTKRVSDDIYTYIVFPGGRSGSVTISRHIDTSSPVYVKPWVNIINSEIVSIKASMYFMPDPSDSTGVVLEGVPRSESFISIESVNGRLAYLTADSSITISNPGTIMCVLDTTPSKDVKLMRAGFSVEPAEENDLITDAILSSECLISSAVAGAPISRDTVIGFNADGSLVPASCDDSTITASGISLNEVKAGDICKYVTTGATRTVKQLIQGSSYYVGLNGALTTVAPDIPSYVQKVGTAIGVNLLQVDLEEVIE